MFKNNWEKTDQLIQLEPNIIKQMVVAAFPSKKLNSYNIISGGCANLNIKINVDEKNYILRIYISNKDAIYLEQKLYSFIKLKVPVPEIYYISQIENYPFAIIEYMEGMTLREFLLNHYEEDIETIMKEAGLILGHIHKYQFSKAGFFNKDLNITQAISKQEYIDFGKKCLKSPMVLDVIPAENINRIKFILEKYGPILPDETEHHLIHGDYDPANILVAKKEGKWKITAILDWEYAFSGSSLTDIANMLRYAHKMPQVFEKAFTEGIKEGGVIFKNKWRLAINLINLISLLELLARSSRYEHPNRCNDINELINYLVNNLN